MQNKIHKILASFVLFAAACSALAQAPAKRTELYGQRASLFKELGVDSTTIVFFGNSLTHGCEWHELLRMPNVVNRGINGDTADGMDERIETVTTGKPAKIFFLCGANDVSHNLTPDSIAKAVIAVVDKMREQTPETKIYLQSLLPINNSFNRYKAMAGKEETIRQVNALLEPLAAERGVTWINLYPAFCDDEGNLKKELTNDGLHLLAPGYLIWKDIVMPYVKE